MSEPTTSPASSEKFTLGQPISGRPGAVCFSALRTDCEKRYIVKRVSLPASQVQADALVLSGFPPEALSAYYKERAEELCREAELLNTCGFLPYHHHWMEPTETGWQVFLAAPKRKSLARELRTRPMTHREAVQLGIDLCAALSLSREAGWLYIALKPENVFRMKNGQWRVGDLGFAPLDGLEEAFLPETHRSFYSPPETTDALASLNATVDTYALGLMLYQMFNGGVLPFENAQEHRQWLAELAGGRSTATPEYADEAMKAIIMKACAPNPAARYQSPDEMGFALLRYQQKEKPGPVALYDLPQKPQKPRPPVAAPIPQPQPLPEPKPEPRKISPPKTAPARPKVRKPLPKGPIYLALAVLLAVWGWMSYEKYCIHTIRDLRCDGSGTTLTIAIDTDMDDALLTVLCKDNYGNAARLQPSNGRATFENLRPGAQYIITLVPDGIHRLRGQTTLSYSTPSDTRITHLTAVTGQEAGSAIISFGVEGIDSESWTLTYGAEGVQERSITFGDHTALVTGLEVGKAYTFRLTAPVEIRLVGETTLTHTASELIYPQDLSASAYENGTLTVTWKAPKGVTVDRWMAHCYDGAGCDLLVECTEPKAVFQGITPGSVYTIEVIAANMTVGKRVQFEVKAG